METTAFLAVSQIMAARLSSSLIEAGLGGSTRGSTATAVSTSVTEAADSASASPGRSHPLTVSIHTSVMPLPRMLWMSAASVRVNLLRQNGCSIHEPHSSCRCMPSCRSLDWIFFSTVSGREIGFNKRGGHDSSDRLWLSFAERPELSKLFYMARRFIG